MGLFCGLVEGAIGVVRAVADQRYFVDWEDNEIASRDDWCGSCLRPIDDPKALSLDELANNIGWKLPTKEPA
jgi:hypothetical protein